MFKTNRIFTVISNDSGLPVWYFLTREGRQGPFVSEADARRNLDEFILKSISLPNHVPRTRFVPAY
ncbi:DUF6316 family protein [Methylomonas koyamae]|uniref:DUF6316 family protein n=1 Tax=Methylomonas koyamae TaxID=702114 RepID=UPI000AC2F01E